MIPIKSVNDSAIFDTVLQEYNDKFRSDSNGFEITIEYGNRLQIVKKETEIRFLVRKKADIFKLFTVLLERDDDCFSQSMETSFQNFSFFLDCSRCAIINVKTFQKLALKLALLGYDQIFLYTEDNYFITDEPYFGHMRGRFSPQDFKVMDGFCQRLGIELSPAIQTLSHLDNIFLWPRFEKIFDIRDVLIVEDDDTYGLIDNMFASMSNYFTSKIIHIGFDEAYAVGCGQYYDRHGFYKDRFDLQLNHLKKVLQIAEKYGFHCTMWADMFLHSQKNSSEIAPLIPNNVEICYWNYFSTDENIYRNDIKKLQQLNINPTFACACWKWLGFAPLNKKGIARSKPGVNCAKKMNIKNVIVTTWGDNGSEAPVFSIIPQIAAISQYQFYSNFDEDKTAETFRAVFNADINDFYALDLPNELMPEYEEICNPCKYLFYNDPLSGLTDYHVNEQFQRKYTEYARIFKSKISKNQEYAYLFSLMYRLCDFLSVKANIGNVLHTAYTSGDKDTLKQACEQIIPTCIKKLGLFEKALRKSWFNEYKEYGLDVLQLRIGGLEKRLKETKLRLQEYLNNKILSIPELTEPKLPFSSGTETMMLYKHNYKYMATPYFPFV